jgi:tetratricopeptide (TPR) repeat protein
VIWVVHPLLTEAVNYVSQRTELLMSLFYLLTQYASVRAHTVTSRLKPAPTSAPGPRVVPGSSRTRWLILSVVACALGMASKETMATAPIMALLYDRVFIYRSLTEAIRDRWRLYAALAATWLLLGTLIWSGPRWESAGFSAGISPWTYLLNQSVMLVEYLQRAVWPASLVLDYGEPRSLTLGDVAWQAALIVTLLVLAAVALARWPAIGFAAAAFFIILAPTSSFVPIATEVGAERRMYLPLAALAVIGVAGIRALWLRHGRAAAGAGMAITLAAACLALAVLTVQRNADYRDELTLWRTTLERSPQPRAHRNYATLLKRAGYRDEVIAHLRESLEGHPEARYGLGYELYEQGRLEEAVEELRRFVREVPSDRFVASARSLAANALLRLARYDEAASEFEAITRTQPELGAAWSNLGTALARAGQTERAVAALQHAVDLEPANGTSRSDLAAVLLEAGNAEGAVVHAQEAARLEPSNATARFLAGLALSAVGRMGDAEAHLRASLQLDPANADARELLARVHRAKEGLAPPRVDSR